MFSLVGYIILKPWFLSSEILADDEVPADILADDSVPEMTDDVSVNDTVSGWIIKIHFVLSHLVIIVLKLKLY